MNHITKSLLLFFFLGWSQNLNAQKIKPLKIGDTVPDILLEKMLYYKDESASLSDFKGKAIIIDQWFIGCGPCVAAMPKLDSLQKEFASDLQIIPVTYEKSQDVMLFWNTHPIVKGIKLSQAVEDRLISSFFPAVVYPQQIWIDKAHKVVSITNGAAANKENIIALINGQKLNVKEKRDELDSDVRMAKIPNMVSKYEQNKDKILFYSYFSSYRPELAGYSFSKVDKDLKQVRVLSNNASLFRLYDFAYANNSSIETRHIPTRFIRRDTSPILSNGSEENEELDKYCYELIYQGTTTKGFSNYMIADLDKFFKIKSSEVLMDIDCYIISPKGNGNKYREIYQANRKSYQTVSLFIAKRVISNDMPIIMIEKTINQTSTKPVLFEIKGFGKINFETRWDLDDLKMMNKDLAKFDLQIETAKRLRKVIILEDK